MHSTIFTELTICPHRGLLSDSFQEWNTCAAAHPCTCLSISFSLVGPSLMGHHRANLFFCCSRGTCTERPMYHKSRARGERGPRSRVFCLAPTTREQMCAYDSMSHRGLLGSFVARPSRQSLRCTPSWTNSRDAPTLFDAISTCS